MKRGRAKPRHTRAGPSRGPVAEKGPRRKRAPRFRISAVLGAAAALAVLTASCELFRNVEPLPPSRQQYVGVWRSSAGFVLRIKAAGTAVIAQVPDTADPESDALNIKVAAPVINDLRVEFHGDTSMLVITPLLYAREYRITRAPFADGDTVKMVLNGVTLVRR